MLKCGLTGRNCVAAICFRREWKLARDRTDDASDRIVARDIPSYASRGG